ncbi:MAG: DNA-processing protein DprA [Spirochaetes bacterium]|nr:DNA-processing protein DprA [Spirochaetota bacterium]
MNTAEVYAVALSICSSPALNRIWDSIQLFKPEDLYKKLLKTRGLETQGFIQAEYPADPLAGAEKICDECRKKNINILTYWDDRYPKFLREISRPPITLYCKGNLTDEKSLAIVGTRKADKKSSDIARRLSSELSQAGFTIVSGMAIGIDREAHLGALKNNGSTIGVLANGIDIVYPSYNKDIYSAILTSEKSSLISEYPPGIFAGKWTFVRRNRIISGLALGTVIVKAAQKSGALITAHHALEQNREVFVCPGFAFDSSYDGCNELIKSGAILVSCTEDILKELSDYKDRIAAMEGKTAIVEMSVAASPRNPDSPDLFQKTAALKERYSQNSIESKILKILANGETDIDSIVRLLDHSANEINEAIVLMELSSDISRDGNMISIF